eukprot:1589190-Rhodomonas_salina.1
MLAVGSLASINDKRREIVDGLLAAHPNAVQRSDATGQNALHAMAVGCGGRVTEQGWRVFEQVLQASAAAAEHPDANGDRPLCYMTEAL